VSAMKSVESELVWIERAKAGDQHAFGRLVESYQRAVYNLCYRMLGNAMEAEDAAQETFLRAFARLDTYDEARKFSSWLLSIGSHHCIDCLRRRRFTWVDIDDVAPLLPATSRADEPEGAALSGESKEEIQKMLASLSPDHRSVVVLHYWHQLSYEEIGHTLKLSEPAVKSRLYRARKALADQMLSEKRLQPQSRLLSFVRG
jgi:RNA polymerase sigma-70 factor (ECF subfamily)